MTEENKMDAFHTFRVRENGKDVALADFELFTLIISALKWRQHNGIIRLIKDNAGAEYIYKRGLTDVWNSTEVILDEIKSLKMAMCAEYLHVPIHELSTLAGLFEKTKVFHLCIGLQTANKR